MTTATQNSQGTLAALAGQIVSVFGKDGDRRSGPDQKPESETVENPGELDRIGAFLSNVDLEPTPANYTLAWEYHFGTNFALRCATEEILDRVGLLTSDQVDELLAAHSETMSSDGIQQLVNEGKDLISTGEKTLSKSRNDSAEYGVALQESLDSMDPDDGAWASRFEALLQITNAMVDRSKKAEKKLKSASQRLTEMNEELQKAKESAEVDQLTGLNNRRAFERHFAAAVERSNKHASNLSVAFVDIDHFKQINDTHGHDTGDRVLVEIAKQLNKMANGSCHVARHGGEEFVLLFEGKNASEAREIVDNCREHTASRSLTNRDTKKPIGSVTFSAGIASLNNKTGARELLRNSDIALYYAKRHGRNQAIIFDEIPAEEE